MSGQTESGAAVMLAMLHNKIEILVGRSEAHKLGPDDAKVLLDCIRKMAREERIAGIAQGRSQVGNRIQNWATRLQAESGANGGPTNG